MSAAGDARGFTLIEMLVVMAITGLVSALAFPSLDRAMRRQAFEGTADSVVTALRAARAAAIRSGTPVDLAIGAGGRVLLRNEAPPMGLPPGTTVALPARGIMFFGDGTSTGGTLTIAGDGRARRLTVDPGTGAVATLR